MMLVEQRVCSIQEHSVFIHYRSTLYK